MPKELNVIHHFLSKPLMRLLTGVVILILGLFLSDIPTMIISQEWPTVEGFIISSKLVGTSIKEYDNDYYTETKAFIRYQYSVNGILYSSSRVNSIDSPFSLYPASFARRYPVGQDVSVHYNPRDPSKALLEPGFVFSFKAVNILDFIVMGAGLYIIVQFLISFTRSIPGKQY